MRRPRRQQVSPARRRLPPRGLWLALLVSLLVGGGLAWLHLEDGLPAGLEEFEGKTLDWRFRLRGDRPAPESVVVLAIDDRSLALLGRFPLPRAEIARAVVSLNEAGARTVALDLLLLEREQPSDGSGLSPGDLALRDALRRQGRAVLAAALLFELGGEPLGEEMAAALDRVAFRLVERPAGRALAVPRASGALLPILPFLRVAALGHVTLLLEPDGAPRRLHLAVDVERRLLPAFALEAARLQRGLSHDELMLSLGGHLEFGGRRIALDRHFGLPLDYYGPARSFATHSLADLLQGRLPPEAFAGKLVLVGATALGVGDAFPTPFAQALPGVEVLATAVANLLADESLERPASLVRWEALACLLAALLAFGLCNLPRPRLAALLALAGFLAWPLAAYLLFLEAGLWVNATLPTLAFALTAVPIVAGRTTYERRMRREAERQRGNLARYVSPLMAEQLAEEDEPSFDRREQDAAILFFDLSGFTGLAEAAGPGATASFLRDFHQRLEEVVARHAGVVEQFVGDGAMMIFGLPQPRDDDPVRALACARDLLVTLGRWRPDLGARASLHFGPVVMARLGGRTQGQVAAAGDTVNLASRLENVAREGGWALVVSDALVAAVAAAGRRDLLDGLKEEASQSVRGRVGRVTVWRASHAALGLA